MTTNRWLGGGFGRHHLLTLTISLAALIAAPNAWSASQQSPTASTSEYASELIEKADRAWEDERYDEAAEAYRQAFLVDHTNKRAAYRLGWCYNEQQKYDDAIWVLKDAVALDPTSEKSRTELGFAYRSAERYQEALETYQQLLTINRKSTDALYYIGWIHNERGEFRDAIESLREAVRLDPERGEAFEDLGYAYRKTGKYDEAVVAYTSAIALEPEEASPLKALGDVYFLNLRQYDKAVSAYQKSLQLDPANAPAQYNLGWLFNEVERFEAAIEPLTLATQLEPQNVEAWNELGFALRKTKQNDSSYKAYARALELAPDNGAAHFGIADLFFYELKDYKVAIDQYSIGLRFDRDGKALRNVGASYNALKSYADAVDPLEKAGKLLPEDSSVYLELGIAYEGLGRTDDAEAAYKNSIRLSPESTEAQSRLNRWIEQYGDRPRIRSGVN